MITSRNTKILGFFSTICRFFGRDCQSTFLLKTVLIISAILLMASLQSNALAQDAAKTDSTFFVQQVQDLIQQEQYATAQIMLEERIQQEGMKPFYLLWMIRNGLQHYYRHENYEIFYLRDNNSALKRSESDSLGNVKIARLRYPQRLLQNIIQSYPNYARAYKLLGDYYDIQLRDLSDFDFVQKDDIKDLEEKIFSNYIQAENLGLKSPYIYRWLGDYYLNSGQPDLAVKYYRKNIESNAKDAIPFFRLAEINFQKKQYTQAYNYALQSLKYFSPSDVYLKYDAERVAAKSLKTLGEQDKFLYYINESIQMLPYLQDSYIDLYHFYEENGNTEDAENVLRKMLMNNPYDQKGYQVTEKYVVKQKSYYFADSLSDEMLIKYENWDEALANIYWFKGNLAYYRGLPPEAKKFWDLSRNYMRRYLPEDSPLIKQVGEIALKKATN